MCCRRLPVFAAAIAGIHQPGCFEAVEGVLIQVVTAVLIGDFAIPLKTESFERAQNVGSGAGHFARGVKVFNADQPFALMSARVGIGGDGGQ